MYALPSQPSAPPGFASLVARAARPSSVRAASWRVGLGIFAGFVLGLDIVLACLVEQLLKASPADDLVVPGVLHSGWSPARGVFFDLGPAGFAIFAGCVLLGASCGWALAVRAAARTEAARAEAARATGVRALAVRAPDAGEVA